MDKNWFFYTQIYISVKFVKHAFSFWSLRVEKILNCNELKSGTAICTWTTCLLYKRVGNGICIIYYKI